MATVILTIDDQHFQKVVDAYCDKYSYDTDKLEGESRNDFFKRVLAIEIKQETKKNELRKERAASQVPSVVNNMNIVIS